MERRRHDGRLYVYIHIHTLTHTHTVHIRTLTVAGIMLDTSLESCTGDGEREGTVRE